MEREKKGKKEEGKKEGWKSNALTQSNRPTAQASTSICRGHGSPHSI